MGQLSHRVDIPFPVFDADNHLYETQEALTKYLPKEYKDVIDYVEVNGRTKIAVQRPDQRLHPQPDLRGGRRPGARRSTSRSATPTARASARSSASRCGPSRRSASPARAWS